MKTSCDDIKLCVVRVLKKQIMCARARARARVCVCVVVSH
jgi:hypothetical protein